MRTWTCGCGWTNGVNLPACARCGRAPDNHAVQDERDGRPVEVQLTDFLATMTREQPDRLTPQDRYLNEPTFHLLVDHLHAEIRRAVFTPSELREAVILACIHHEQLAVRSYEYDLGVSLGPDWQIRPAGRR